jgi:ubiquinol-cytochrome c reductase subunit 6
MGIWDAFSEIVEAVTPWSVVEAEAPAEETQVGGMSFWEERETEKRI